MIRVSKFYYFLEKLKDYRETTKAEVLIIYLQVLILETNLSASPPLTQNSVDPLLNTL
jgi:hypothetical protein